MSSLLKYFIVEQQSFDGIFSPEHKDMTFVENGVFNIDALSESKFNKDLLLIPSEKQKELKEKGKTEFEVYRKITISIGGNGRR